MIDSILLSQTSIQDEIMKNIPWHSEEITLSFCIVILELIINRFRQRFCSNRDWSFIFPTSTCFPLTSTLDMPKPLLDSNWNISFLVLYWCAGKQYLKYWNPLFKVRCSSPFILRSISPPDKQKLQGSFEPDVTSKQISS